MKKKLIIVNGAPGVGKTITCRELQRLLNRSVWLDGDWCWMANPWIVTEETKKMVEANMTFLLDRFLNCSEYRFVLFSWIFRSDEVFSHILNCLRTTDFVLQKFTLTCDENVYRDRLELAGREKDKIAGCLESLRLCETTDSVKIDTTQKSIEKVARILHDRIRPCEYRRA